MVRIYEDWYVTVETTPLNYIVRRGSGEIKTTGKRTGPVDDPIAYCGSLASAIKYVREQVIAERLKGPCIPLGDALETVRKLNAEFVEIIRREC